MTASFPGDPTAKTSIVRVSQSNFAAYADGYLWADGLAPLAGLPRYETFKSVGLVMQRPELDQYIQQFWEQSHFLLTKGSPAIVDLVLYLGRQRSTDDEDDIAAFKSISTLSIKTHLENWSRQKLASFLYVQFFHVFEPGSSEQNYHTHNLIFSL